MRSASCFWISIQPPRSSRRAPEGALKIQEEQPELDLVVLDLGMPGVSGTALLEAMVAKAPEMKILVLSGNQDQRSVMRVLQLGAAGFVPKSMASETLLSAVKFVLSGGVYIPADLLEEVNRAGIFGTSNALAMATAGWS